MKGQINVYTCKVCGAKCVTIDRDEGTTPFVTACPAGCVGHAQSGFYTVDQTLAPTHEWYRPDAAETEKITSPATRDHIARGGLILRRIAS